MTNPTRWGFLSCGKICADFASAILSDPNKEHDLVTVAARNVAAAQEFSTKYGFHHVSQSYEELVQDPSVEVVYVGSINPEHCRLVKLAIHHGKHVLCEKPLGMNLKEVTEMADLARAKGVFLMEGIWSRFFPIYARLRQEIELGTIGDVVQAIVPFCTMLTHKDRCSMKVLGGGTVLDIGVYCVQLASFIFKGAKPLQVIGGGHLNDDEIDEAASATVLYAGGKTATLIMLGNAKYEGDAVVIGTKGVLKIPFRFWCPTELITPTEIVKMDLPKTDYSFNYANSVGLLYEAQHVRRCLQQGLTESPLLTHAETLIIAEIMESIRKQSGVVYSQDK